MNPHGFRSQGWLFPHKHLPITQEIPEVCGWGAALPELGTPVWTSDGAEGVHHSAVGGSSVLSLAGGHSVSLLGLLVPQEATVSGGGCGCGCVWACWKDWASG